MNAIELVSVALALAMDAFAVSIAAGSTKHIVGPRPAFRLAFHFGLFQFGMPILGWLAGRTIEPLIAPVDHWVAFLLLVFIGIRMLRPGAGQSGTAGGSDPSRGIVLIGLAIATSIDAFAVGLSLAMLRIEIWLPSVIIGTVTASLSLVGIFLGVRLRQGIGRKAELAGGLVLILIAIKIVLSHELA